MTIDTETCETLRTEVTLLRQRITDLEQQIEEHRQNEERNRLLLESSPDPIVVYDAEGRALYVNPAFETTFGWTQEELLGDRIDFVPPENLAETKLGVERALAGEKSVILTTKRYTKDRRILDMQISASVFKDQHGRPAGMMVVLRNITDQLRAEQERLTLQEQVIEAQQAALRELSTPLIPLADGLVAMPLIGSIDSSRAQQVLETLLDGISSNHASIAIIDITGVPVVDTQVAAALLRAAQAAELLGARVVLTGIRPEVAQTLVGIGVSLGGTVTRSTLQSGITFAMGQMGR